MLITDAGAVVLIMGKGPRRDEEEALATRIEALRVPVLFRLEGEATADGVGVAIDPETGERLWKRGRYGHGQLILIDDLLLITTEKGDVVLVEATPEEHRELARLDALDGKTWNPPALSGRLLLVRNNLEAACYELPVEG